MKNTPMIVEPVILSGQYVRLEPLSVDHFDRLWEIGREPDLWKWVPYHITTPDRMHAYIKTALDSQAIGSALPFVTIDGEGYLDQLVVGPEHWGSDAARLLVEEAKRLSPTGVTLLVNKDNARAIRFYERNGFAQAGDDVNPTSGRPVLRMAWRP